MYSMFSTPFTDSSMGVATTCANVSAVAPGYVALMTTVGGAISGYCATGSVGYATTPKMMISVERTAAKIGLSIKKCGKRMRAGRYCCSSVACEGGGAAPGNDDGEVSAARGLIVTRDGCTVVPGCNCARPSSTTR